jgi:two-component system, NarL family, invasion response regulator UvrY
MPNAERSSPGRDRARVLAVDDHAAFLAVVRDVLAATAHLELVGEADSGERAVVAARELQPDMVLMDVHMPGLGGIGAAARIKASSPSTLMVLISTTHPEEIPLKRCDAFIEAVVWKSVLAPKILDEIWLWHRAPPAGRRPGGVRVDS